MDINGKKIFLKNFKDACNVDVSFLSSGVYLLHVFNSILQHKIFVATRYKSLKSTDIPFSLPFHSIEKRTITKNTHMFQFTQSISILT